MASNYQSISAYNEKKLGEDRASRKSQVAMYTDPVHFIFELLQNADDANATKISFILTAKQLTVEHDGKPFTESNVKAISYFEGSDKTESGEEITKIGHFGLGFKSVFTYTSSPRIHSGHESFEINNLFSVTGIDYPSDLEQGKTRFVFPFDHHTTMPDYIEPRKLKSAEDAYRDIANKLETLGTDTLLFTECLKEISWSIKEGNGHYRRYDTSINDYGREVYIVTGESEKCCYLIFDRPISWQDDNGTEKSRRPVQIAFELDKRLNDGGVIRPIKNTRLFVIFSTTKETHIGFILQGPYRTNPTRENVFPDDDFNQHLVNETATLLINSLHSLKNLQLLNLDVLAALPIKYDKFEKGTFFYPLYLEVRNALVNQSLLPTADHDFICCSQAKLARGADLTRIFESQLEMLFNTPGLKWIDSKLTENNYPDLHLYLVGKKYPYRLRLETEPLLDGIQIDADDIAPKLTEDFFKEQSLKWLIDFILYTKNSTEKIKQRPFIRLENGKHVCMPVDDKADRTAWFAPDDNTDDLSEFQIVKYELAANEPVRKFLEEKHIRPIDPAAIVEVCILPNYKGTDTPLDVFIRNEPTYRDHLRQIHKAYIDSKYDAREQLTISLNNSAWLACVNASGNDHDKFFWKMPGADNLFKKTPSHEIWFAGLENIDAYFAHSIVSEELGEIATNLLKPLDKLTKNLSLSDNETLCLVSEIPKIEQWKYLNGASYYHGLNGFKPNVTIQGLEQALNSWDINRFRIFWNILLSAPRIISGKIKSETNKSRLSRATPKLIDTEVGKLCYSHQWMPDKIGNWHKPSDLLLTDLPDEFETSSFSAKEVAEKLGMKKPEVVQAINVIAGNDQVTIDQIERFLSASGAEREKMLKIIPQEIPPQPAPSFREGLSNMSRSQCGNISENGTNHSSYPLNNPERYQNKANQEVEEKVRLHEATPQTIRFSLVRESSSNQEARNFLYQEYQGKCQVTGNTFPKASANTNGDALNYFEASSLLSYSNADYLNDAGNMICISADTMAKFKHASFEWLEDLDAIIQEFNNKRPGEMDNIKTRIKLAGAEYEITWSKRHFSRLVSLYEKS